MLDICPHCLVFNTKQVSACGEVSWIEIERMKYRGHGAHMMEWDRGLGRMVHRRLIVKGTGLTEAMLNGAGLRGKALRTWLCAPWLQAAKARV